MRKILSLLCILLLCGCDLIKNDIMEDIDIYTTTYPNNYLINYLYKGHSTVYSIYPNGVNFKEYKLSEKKINDFSKSDLFVFNSQDQDRNYAVDMINANKNLKVIDTSLGMQYTYSIEELWLNPYNYLMMAKNIKESLNEYINNQYLIDEINSNYENLKYELSKLDANYKENLISNNYNTIVTDNTLFKFLEKYNLNVISLEEDIKTIVIKEGDSLSSIAKEYNISISDILTYNNKTEESIKTGEVINIPVKTIDSSDLQLAKKLIEEDKVKYIYTASSETNPTVKKLIEDNELELIKINDMYSVDGGITNNNEDYLTIMNNNLELFKKELIK